MKDKEKENQKPANQKMEDIGLEPQSLENAMANMPPELEDTRHVTRQNRFVTYFVDKTKDGKASPEQKENESVKGAQLSAEDQDMGETQVREIPTEQQEEKPVAESQTNQVRNVKVTPEKYNAEEKALQSFAEVLINHLEKIDVGDWTRPWIFDQDMRWPQNIDGREYAASNAIILLMHTQQRGYVSPVYATYDRFHKLNFVPGTKDKPLKDADGKTLPWVKVNEGAKSMPVVKTLYTAVNKETKEKIPFADYAKLPQSERKQYNVYPRNFVYRVFNIDQTNLKEARPELYAELTKGLGKKFSEIRRDEDMCFPAIDAMIMKDLWQCPIVIEYGPQAYYAPIQDRIIMPEKKQFRFPESYYGTLFHECAHSTGAKHRYDRDLDKNPKSYAREELVAELTAALVASRYGLEKHVKSDSLPYLKTWLNELKEKPEFIKQLLTDVRKASSQIIRRVDVIQARIEELRNMGVPEPEHYPVFLDLNPITHQPVADPLRYYSKDEDNALEEKPSFGRGRR